MGFTVHIRQTSASASEAAIRTHTVAVDRPVDKGGSDQGPMGGELFLAATGGCFMSTLLAAIRARDAQAQIHDVLVEVEGTLEQSPARFTAIELRVSAECEDRALFEKLVDVADRGCIMMNTLRGTLDVRIRVSAGVEA